MKVGGGGGGGGGGGQRSEGVGRTRVPKIPSRIIYGELFTEHNGACYMASVNIHVSDQPPAHFFLPTCFRHYCHYFPMRMRELC